MFEPLQRAYTVWQVELGIEPEPKNLRIRECDYRVSKGLDHTGPAAELMDRGVISVILCDKVWNSVKLCDHLN